MNDALTIQELWDYNDPAGSEMRFRAALEDATPAAFRLQLQTQIARTYSLRRQFDKAHNVLDDVERQLEDAPEVVRVRYLLERGRTYNSNGDKDEAKTHFTDAWEVARSNEIDGLAVDAAHMIAIVETGDRALQWNTNALELANSSDDPDARRWRASLHNNLGWTYHEQRDFDTALKHFAQALEAQQEKDDAELVRVAKWCVGRCYRSLGRVEEALAVQRHLERTAANGLPDGYVCEELAECLHALGRTDEARSYFQQAYDLLSQDASLMEYEPQRIERLRRLGKNP